MVANKHRTPRGAARVLWSKCKGHLPKSLMIDHLSNHDDKPILLTFDDGPDTSLTPQVLSLLDKFKARAIFFVVGSKGRRHPDLLREIIAEGHLIGNHTYSHPNRRISSFAEYKSELSRTQAVIEDATGQPAIYFRPPLGKISPLGILATKRHRMKTILWSNGGGEWGQHEGDEAQVIASRLSRSVMSGDIVLLHDNYPQIEDILANLLPALKARGFDMSNSIMKIP